MIFAYVVAVLRRLKLFGNARRSTARLAATSASFANPPEALRKREAFNRQALRPDVRLPDRLKLFGNARRSTGTGTSWFDAFIPPPEALRKREAFNAKVV